MIRLLVLSFFMLVFSTEAPALEKKPTYKVRIGDTGGSGSISLIKYKGQNLILTVLHVCVTPKLYVIGEGREIELTVLRKDPITQLCQLKGEVPGKYLEISDDTSEAVSLGYPGRSHTLKMVPLKYYFTISTYTVLDGYKGILFPGMSGGPTINPKINKIIGLNEAKTNMRLSFLIPSNNIIVFLEGP